MNTDMNMNIDNEFIQNKQKLFNIIESNFLILQDISNITDKKIKEIITDYINILNQLVFKRLKNEEYDINDNNNIDDIINIFINQKISEEFINNLIINNLEYMIPSKNKRKLGNISEDNISENNISNNNISKNDILITMSKSSDDICSIVKKVKLSFTFYTDIEFLKHDLLRFLFNQYLIENDKNISNKSLKEIIQHSRILTIVSSNSLKLFDEDSYDIEETSNYTTKRYLQFEKIFIQELKNNILQLNYDPKDVIRDIFDPKKRYIKKFILSIKHFFYYQIIFNSFVYIYGNNNDDKIFIDVQILDDDTIIKNKNKNIKYKNNVLTNFKIYPSMFKQKYLEEISHNPIRCFYMDLMNDLKKN
jgi:hypothetical protein